MSGGGILLPLWHCSNVNDDAYVGLLPPNIILHCKKELAVFPSPAGMSLIKLFLGGNNLVFSRPERVWSVTSRLGTGKWLTLFYSVKIMGSICVRRLIFLAARFEPWKLFKMHV
jgi:hypothetical protein